MKKLLKIPPKPTAEEEKKLDCSFYLPDWQFNSLIESHSTIISSRIISWTKHEPQYVSIYGLRALKKDSGKNCFANFFLLYQYDVYQFFNIEDAISMIDLLKKQTTYQEYQDKLWKKRFNEKQKRKKERFALKKLPVKVVKAA